MHYSSICWTVGSNTKHLSWPKLKLTTHCQQTHSILQSPRQHHSRIFFFLSHQLTDWKNTRLLRGWLCLFRKESESGTVKTPPHNFIPLSLPIIGEKQSHDAETNILTPRFGGALPWRIKRQLSAGLSCTSVSREFELAAWKYTLGFKYFTYEFIVSAQKLSDGVSAQRLTSVSKSENKEREITSSFQSPECTAEGTMILTFSSFRTINDDD